MKSLLMALALLGGLPLFAAGQPLRIVVAPVETTVQFREPFAMTLRVENPTTTTQTIRVMCCSWGEEWRSSDTNVTWNGWDCDKNFPLDVPIPPGGAYTNQAQMFIYNIIPNKDLTFRMGFTSIGSTNTYWSNRIKLHLLPPDTWTHGGHYYRDRNHDGKIDWEVSGKTWTGHPAGSNPYVTSTNSAGQVIVTEIFTGQGVDVYKADTNYDGFYDLEYGAGGTNGIIQWTKPIHERVPRLGKDFAPIQRESWMDWWKP